MKLSALTIIAGHDVYSIDRDYFEERFLKERQFENLLACRRSGQISDAQWNEHLKDREFVAFLRRVMAAI